MKIENELRAWKVYGTICTLSFVVLATSAFTVARQRAQFGTIDVQRINLVEPDGTLRMVIADQANFPGAIVKGKEYPFDRHTAGMLFYNDEGSENGGLIFGGRKTKDGALSSYGHLSFDQYDQDQGLSLEHVQSAGGHNTRLTFLDQPDWPLPDLLKLPHSQWPHFLLGHPSGTPRLTMERAQDGSVSLVMKDKQGRTRVRIEVDSEGAPVIQLLDTDGKVTSQMPSSGR